MVARDEEWFLAHGAPDIVDPGDDARDLQARAEVLAGREGTYAGTKRLVRADGSRIIVEHSVGLLKDDRGAPISFVSLFVDVTKAHEAQRRLAFLASHDPLTQADNRTELLAGLRRALIRQPRIGTRVGALFIDLDGLKAVNDSLGHAAGDRLIVRVADAEAIAAKIHRALNEPFDIDGHAVPSSVSIGIAIAETDEDAEHPLARDDRAMYVAKRAGRDATVVCSESLMGA